MCTLLANAKCFLRERHPKKPNDEGKIEAEEQKAKGERCASEVYGGSG